MKFPVEKRIKCFSPEVYKPSIRNKLLSYQTDFTIWLSPNSKHKTQGCVHFTRKSYTMSTKIPETRRTSSNSSNFLRRHRLFSGSLAEARLRCR